MSIKKKIIVYILGIAILTGLIIYTVILPTIKDIKKISAAIFNERVDLEKKYVRGQLLRKTISDFEKIKTEEIRLKNIFVQTSEELKFITLLEKIASNNQITQSLKLLPQDDKGSAAEFAPLSLEINLQGSFLNILKYLKDLENLNYYFNISSLNLTVDNNYKYLITSLQGKIYTLPILTNATTTIKN